jgi:hypothetical protein
MRLLALSACFFIGEALACGVCVEDKIAAVYDHAAVHQAIAAKRTVVFFAIDGKLVSDERTRRAIAAAARAAPGVDPASVRVSTELASLALAFDARRANLAAVEKSLDARLSTLGLSLLTMQVRNK